eukprot:7628423-Alexandrium_andersonii.AAC.1
MPVLPPNECINAEVKQDVSVSLRLREAHDEGELPEAYGRRPVVRAGGLVLPLALYVDAVPYSTTDSVAGFWFINLITGVRHLFCALRKRLLCKCGCRGWCSYYQVFRLIEWSTRCMAEG